LNSNELSSGAIHLDFPTPIRTEIEQALGTDITRVRRPRSGMWEHTYLVGDRANEWIVRLQKAPAPRLKRSFVAQQEAASVGMSVPKILAYRLDTSEPEGYIWIAEEYVCGSEFYPEKLDREVRLATSVDIGRQLRLLHTVKVNGFGPLTPDLLNAEHATWGEWLDEQETNIEAAVRIAGIRSEEIPTIRNAYRFLRNSYTDLPRLCHGDFAADNLLVEGGRLVAAVDWENALACDPAYDVAYWCRWHENLECLDALLSGYRPREPVGFRQRVIAHHILLAVDFIVWYEEQEDQEGVEDCRKMLRESVENPSDFV
jgi:aminoglycoside phosphotransferase (APT) family kinase protein